MIAIDPICYMTIEADAAVASATINGETYYFCSEGCERMFLAEQAQPVKAESASCCQSSCCGGN